MLGVKDDQTIPAASRSASNSGIEGEFSSSGKYMIGVSEAKPLVPPPSDDHVNDCKKAGDVFKGECLRSGKYFIADSKHGRLHDGTNNTQIRQYIIEAGRLKMNPDTSSGPRKRNPDPHKGYIEIPADCPGNCFEVFALSGSREELRKARATCPFHSRRVDLLKKYYHIPDDKP